MESGRNQRGSDALHVTTDGWRDELAALRRDCWPIVERTGADVDGVPIPLILVDVGDERRRSALTAAAGPRVKVRALFAVHDPLAWLILAFEPPDAARFCLELDPRADRGFLAAMLRTGRLAIAAGPVERGADVKGTVFVLADAVNVVLEAILHFAALEADGG